MDLRQAPPSFWLLLGECTSAVRHLMGVPLPATEVRVLEHELLAMGLHARLAMDGSTLTLDQIKQHLKGRLRLPPSQEGYQLEADGLLYTWQRIAAESARPKALDPDLVRSFHASLLETTVDADDRGEWRTVEQGTAVTDGVPAEMIPLFTDELCDWLSSNELAPPSREDRAAYALLHALIAELYLAWIRPFGTAHARISGSVVQHIVLSAGLHPAVGHLISSHFHHSGRTYQHQLEQAARGTSDPIPFITYGLHGLSQGLADLLLRIREIQIGGLWTAHLVDLFEHPDQDPERRQRQLLTDLADNDGPVPLSGLARLSATLAKVYAGVSEKTLRRDVDALEAMGTILRGPEGFTVRREGLRGFKYPK